MRNNLIISVKEKKVLQFPAKRLLEIFLTDPVLDMEHGAGNVGSSEEN
jgi:hypothetical protein